jgi:hypothetical protein
MMNIRLTHNAVVGYQRLLAPGDSISGAYGELKRACVDGQYERQAPAWLRRIRNDTDGYVLLEGDIAALPVRRGRVVACLAHPRHAAR